LNFVLNRQHAPVDSLRDKRPVTIRQCHSQEDVRQLLATVSDIYGYLSFATFEPRLWTPALEVATRARHSVVYGYCRRL
jgi:hypothetical protein